MKKLKLLLSLCMMCLCVAVLCMGILAANSATYNITGNMSYNMIDGVALVNTRVYKIADQKTASELETTATTLSTMTFEAIESSTDLGFILSQKLDTKATLSDGATSSEISDGSININFGAIDSSVWYYTYYIVINITNLTDIAPLSATLTDNTTYTYVRHYVISSQTSIAKGDTKNIVLGLSLSYTTVESVDVDVAYSISVNMDDVGMFSIDRIGTLIMENVEFTPGQTWNDFIETNYVTDDGWYLVSSDSVSSSTDSSYGVGVGVWSSAWTWNESSLPYQYISYYYISSYKDVKPTDKIRSITYYVPKRNASGGSSK